MSEFATGAKAAWTRPAHVGAMREQRGTRNSYRFS